MHLRHYDVPARFGGEEFSDPAAGDDARGGARDRRADPPRGRRAHVRRRDVERADPRDRSRSASPRYPRDGQRLERADPPGRPRRLSREAPGPKPRTRRERRTARSRPAIERQRLAAVPETGDHLEPLPAAFELTPPEERRASDGRTRLTDRASSRSRSGSALLVGFVAQSWASARASLGLLLGSNHDVFGAHRRRRARRRRPGARARGGRRRLDLGQRSRRARRRCPVRPTGGARPRGSTTAVVEWSAPQVGIHRVLFNIGALTLSSLAAACVFAVGLRQHRGRVRRRLRPASSPGSRTSPSTRVSSASRSRWRATSPWSAFWHERFAVARAALRSSTASSAA